MADFSQLQFIVIIIGLLVILGGMLWIMRARHEKTLDHTLRKASRDLLKDFVIPDGNGGEIHIEYALLTQAGVIVADFKDVGGHVFGSNSMQDWTVISNQRRFTFSNPQPALYDRVAAVKRLVPELPVRGYVVFPSRAKFTKGQPSEVTSLDELIDEIRQDDGASSASGDYQHLWSKLRHEAVSMQVGHLLRG